MNLIADKYYDVNDKKEGIKRERESFCRKLLEYEIIRPIPKVRGYCENRTFPIAG